MATESIRLFGAPQGVPGVQVREKVGAPPAAPLQYGTSAFIGGVLKRGPMGVPIPVKSRAAYDEIFGKPSDQTWHLYSDPLKKGFPDAIDGFFDGSRSTGNLWLLRNELDGTGKKASQTFYARSDQTKSVLKITAANEGRWGGYRKKDMTFKVVGFEEDHFILNDPNIGTNELEGAKVVFVGADGSISQEFTIKSNTKSEADGSVQCYVTKDKTFAETMETNGYNSLQELTGTGSYQKYIALSGAGGHVYTKVETLTGTVKTQRFSATVYGVGTSFKSELKRKDFIWINGQRRRVFRILSNKKLLLNRPLTIPSGEYSMESSNVIIRSTNVEAAFDTELMVGDTIRWYSATEGEYLERTVTAINGSAEMEIDEPFPEDFSNETLQYINKWIEGTGTDFTNELKVGDVISAFEGSSTVEVTDIDTVSVPERFAVSEPLSDDLVDINIIIHPVNAKVSLSPPVNNGLSVQLGNGQLYPETHFSVEIFFEGYSVFKATDCSLDPSDSLYIEQSINNANIAYEDDGTKVYTWIYAENLLQDDYLTRDGVDVRPSNATAKILDIDNNGEKLYYYSDGDDKYISGIVDIYFDAYSDPRRYSRSYENIIPVKKIGGTFSSVAELVTGVNTNFLLDYEIGEPFYDPISRESREIVLIDSDTSLTLAEGFPDDVPASTEVYKPGVISLSTSTLSGLTVGNTFDMKYFTDLEGGYDGDTENIPSSYYTRYFDPGRNLLEKAALGKNHGMIRIAVPGVTDTLVQGEGLKYASDRAYEFRVEIPITYNDAIGAENYILKEIGLNDFMSVSFPSYGIIRDPKDGRPRTISLSGEIMGMETYRASASSGYHNLAAGMNSPLRRVRSLPVYIDPFNDEALLNQAGIQPISRKNNLIVPFGARIPAQTDTYKYMHVRRNQSQYIRMFVESVVLHAMLFRSYTPGWDQEVLLYLRGFFERERAKGALNQQVSFGQSVVIERTAGDSYGNSSNPADVYLSSVNGKVYLNISYRPSGIVERIILTVTPDSVVSSTSAN